MDVMKRSHLSMMMAKIIAVLAVIAAQIAPLRSDAADPWNMLLDRYAKRSDVSSLIFVKCGEGSSAELQMYVKHKSAWNMIVDTQAYIGKAGLGKEREGDMRTPEGIFGLTCAFGIKPDPGADLRYIEVEDDTYCCGDSAAYNRIINLRELPHECSGERMIDSREQYAHGLFVGYNADGVPGRGSAIFIHCLGDEEHTAGCIAASEEDVVRMIRAADSRTLVCIFDRSSIPPSAGFVRLVDEVPDVIQEMRYATTYNFIGDRIEGYEVPSAMLTIEAARALRRANEDLMSRGYRIKIFDAYRPQRAVDMFVRWARVIEDTRMKHIFYPSVDKRDLFKRGYIASKSSHSRGSTVDVTLFDMARGCEVDMGGAFDLFDERSHPGFRGITQVQMMNRETLRRAMIDAGFRPLATEWWHFTLDREPYPDTFFDFPIGK